MAPKADVLLCAVDFSESSQGLVRYACFLAQRLKAALCIHHTIPDRSDYLLKPTLLEGAPFRQKKILAAVHRVEQLVHDTNLEWQPSIASGEPVSTIRQAAVAHRADLIILASRRLGTIRRAFLGTIVEQLVRQANVPVCIVPAGLSGEPKNDNQRLSSFRIVMGLDFNDQWRPLLGRVFSWAVKLKAELHLLHAIAAPSFGLKEEANVIPYDQVQSVLLARSRSQIIRAAADFSSNGVAVYPQAVCGMPGESLCAYALEIGADILMVGVRPHKRWEKVLIGSSTEYVLRHAPCPILTLQMGADANG
jgi:nucleotide-binding universal stress UspA family protein